MPDKKQYVPPFSKEDIVNIIKEAIANGTIASDNKPLEDDETYTLKVSSGKVVLVKDEA